MFYVVNPYVVIMALLDLPSSFWTLVSLTMRFATASWYEEFSLINVSAVTSKSFGSPRSNAQFCSIVET